MAKKNKCECPRGVPGWIVTFGDLMSLLLTFFILLLSMSTMDAKKVEAAIGSLAGATSILEGGVKTEINKEIAQEAATSDAGAEQAEQAANIVQEFNEMMDAEGGSSITMEEGEEGFTVRLPSSILFNENEVNVTNQDAILFLQRLALMMENMSPDTELHVIGHTDDTPPQANSIYQNNWEISTARAISVAQILMDNGIGEKKITIAGNAGFRPIATNATPEGRAKNRRVELFFYSKVQEDEDKTRQSVLEMQE